MPEPASMELCRISIRLFHSKYRKKLRKSLIVTAVDESITQQSRIRKWSVFFILTSDFCRVLLWSVEKIIGQVVDIPLDEHAQDRDNPQDQEGIGDKIEHGFVVQALTKIDHIGLVEKVEPV
jgi:hypothetical protein